MDVRRKKYKKYRQGDIFWYDFGGPVLEGVQAGKHPCVIISNDVFNKYSPVVNVLAVSSQKKNSPVHVLIPSGFASVDSYIYCEQWVTANKGKLYDYIGNVGEQILCEALEKLVFHVVHRAKTNLAFDVRGLQKRINHPRTHGER